MERATRAINQSLRAWPHYLDALLLAAQLAIQTENEAAATVHLTTLISLPALETFSDQDILANLPLPTGGSLLAEAYAKLGRRPDAIRIIDLALDLMRSQGRMQPPAELSAKRDALLREAAQP